MPLLLLDPLVLLLLACLLAYVVVVWRGGLRRWFGRPERWTALVWPLPLVVLLAPVLAGTVVGILGRLVPAMGEGGLVDAAVYAAAYLVPVVGMTLWPPRWLLPPWARRRLVAVPSESPEDVDAPPVAGPPGTVTALRVSGAGHGSLARWAWRVDAAPGIAWVEEGHLRFRRSTSEQAPATVPAPEDDETGALELGEDGELWFAPPRGGWRTGRLLDVDLRQIDRWRVHARRPWRRDGVLSLHVEGRRPVHLWLEDVGHVVAGIRALDADGAVGP